MLTGLKINNADADYGDSSAKLSIAINSMDKLVLSYRENFLSFNFAALEYNIPEKLVYRYMMQGIDKNWVDAGTNNTATYTGLPPGTYWFKVNATNATGIWGSNIKVIQIVITPPLAHLVVYWYLRCIVSGFIIFFYTPTDSAYTAAGATKKPI